MLSAVSLGQACAIVQAMPADIRRAARVLGIEPIARINMVDHFAEEDLERIAAHLRAAKVAPADIGGVASRASGLM